MLAPPETPNRLGISNAVLGKRCIRASYLLAGIATPGDEAHSRCLEKLHFVGSMAEKIAEVSVGKKTKALRSKIRQQQFEELWVCT